MAFKRFILVTVEYTPPRKKPVKQQIRDMEPRTSIIIEDASAATVKASASQVSAESRPRRKYRTSKVDGGVQVFRDK